MGLKQVPLPLCAPKASKEAQVRGRRMPALTNSGRAQPRGRPGQCRWQAPPLTAWAPVLCLWPGLTQPLQASRRPKRASSRPQGSKIRQQTRPGRKGSGTRDRECRAAGAEVTREANRVTKATGSGAAVGRAGTCPRVYARPGRTSARQPGREAGTLPSAPDLGWSAIPDVTIH